MRRFLAVYALIAVAAISAGAVIPHTIGYQGVLLDGTGTPVPNGEYAIQFKLFPVETEGVELWSETQTIPVTNGVFRVTLGTYVPIDLSFDAQYWLSVALPPDPELEPRTALAVAPYAHRARFAANAPPDNDWLISGDDIYHSPGTVVVGGLPIEKAGGKLESDGGGGVAERGEHKLQVIGSDQKVGHATLQNSSGVTGVAALYGYRMSDAPSHGTEWTTAGSNSGVVGENTSGDNYSAGVAGYSSSDFGICAGVLGGLYGGAEWGALGYSDAVGTPWGVYTPEDAYVGGALTVPTGASDGHVLTSDASGNASWQPSLGGIGGGGTTNYVAKFTDSNLIGSSILFDNGDALGVGTTTPGSRLVIEESTSGQALEVLSTYVGGAMRTMNLERTSDPTTYNDLLQIKAPATAPDDFQFIECERGTSREFIVDGDGRVTANGGAEINGGMDVSSALPVTATFQSSNDSEAACAIYGEMTSPTADFTVAGVRGHAKPQPGYGAGGHFTGGRYGVRGEVVTNTTAPVYAIHGYAKNIGSPTSTAYGIYTEAENAMQCYGGAFYANGTRANNYGIYAYALGTATSSFAGAFTGDVSIVGTLIKTAGSFRIDHPLDPENRYLSHSFVESPDMMNIYNGNVVLNAAGEAIVEMPEWFEALNKEFRYQLTAVGAPGPNLYVASKISGNDFAIAGGMPGMEVSWQVTGVRQDRYAEENRIPVETWKPDEDAGKYLHPELYGAPETMGVDYKHRETLLRDEPPTRLTPARPVLIKRDREGNDG